MTTRFSLALAAFALQVPYSLPGAERSSTASANAAVRLTAFDEVWSLVRDNYYDPKFNGVDWDSVRVRYRQAAATASDERSLHSVLRAMVGELRDAHTRVLTPKQAEDRGRQQNTSAGVILFEVEGQPVVFAIRPNSPAARAGLKVGMKVTAVNGMPIQQALSRARDEVGPSSSERASQVLSYLRLIGGSSQDPLVLDLTDFDGSPRQVPLMRQTADLVPIFQTARLANDILYVRFDRFRDPVSKLFHKVLLQSPDAKGLVLDLRSNTGGDGREGTRTIAPLFSEPTLIARLQTRTGRAPSALMGLVKLPLSLIAGETGKHYFGKPMVILTDAGTASTSEVIAAALQERGRAFIIGEGSCGCALGVLRYRKLRNGGALAVSEVGLLTGLGKRIEGHGVTPDRVVAATLEDLQYGRDTVLDAAVRHLRAQ